MQNNSPQTSGFTLVEIMIVIVIIGILIGIGSSSELFGTQENKKLEQVSHTILSVIDGTKLDTLLGKTSNGDIVSKRKMTITYEPVNTSISTSIEDTLAKNNNTTPGGTHPTVSLPKLNMVICPNIPAQPTNSLEIEFTNGDIAFLNGINDTEVIIKLGNAPYVREIHIDRRTGLTYEQAGTSMTCPAI